MKIIRSKRKTLSIQIDSQANVVVKAPLQLSNVTILSFVDKKKDWIDKKSRIIKEKNMYFQDFVTFKKVMIRGKVLNIFIDKDLKSIKIEKDCITLPEKNSLLYLKNEIKKSADKYLISRVEEISKTNKLFFKSLTLKNYIRKWGCCNSQTDIILNYKLIMLPDDLIDYVIFHELCHHYELNHSTKFWQILLNYCPKARIFQKIIKEYNIISVIF